MDWSDYWATYPKSVGRTDYLRQVQSTIRGEPISDRQFRLSVEEICNLLELKTDDTVIDLCCGNGLITKELAARCTHVVGVDFSEPLLSVANADHRPDGVQYIRSDVLKLSSVAGVCDRRFTKAVMAGALQHFRRRDLRVLLQSTMELLRLDGIFAITAVPNLKMKGAFYSTVRCRIAHLWYKARGRDAMGTWWNQQWIKTTCEELGLKCQFHVPNDKDLSRYRFDVKVFRSRDALPGSGRV
jgi:cyclopropane fatty-acyl-phospholipid synthase-like methyltransferase